MSTISTAQRTLEATPEQIQAMQQALEAIVNNPQALALARLRMILETASEDPAIQQRFEQAMLELSQAMAARGHESI